MKVVPRKKVSLKHRERLKEFPNLSHDELVALFSPIPSIPALNQKFCRVRDKIDPITHPQAYRVSFSVPLLFYLVYSEDEAIDLLLRNAEAAEPKPWYLWV